MENDLYLKILLFLYSKGIGINTDISHLFDNYLLQRIVDGDLLIYGQRTTYIKSFLDILKNDNHIKYVDSTIIPSTNEWIYPITVKAQITAGGFAFVDRYNLNKSLLLINDASLLNYTIQKWGTGLTILIAGLAATFSVLNYLKPEPKMVELNNSIQSISKEAKSLKEQLLLRQNQKTLPVEKSHKP